MGLPELIIIAIILLLMLGGRKLPELGRGVGEALSELKKTTKDEKKAKKKIKSSEKVKN